MRGRFILVRLSGRTRLPIVMALLACLIEIGLKLLATKSRSFLEALPMFFRSLVLLAMPALIAGAQSPTAPSARAPGQGATLSGTVRDSVTHVALAGATVQLVADTATHFARTVFADSLGGFAIDDLPDGRYSIGFSHPLLDSVGVQAPLRRVAIAGHRGVHLELTTPSPSQLRAAICGPTASDSSGVIVGTVHDARDGSPIPGASVVGQWTELSFTPEGIVRRTPSLVATTGENGWFALCNVPTDAGLLLSASRAADSTDLVEARVPTEGFLRRELYLGAARTVLVPVTSTGDTTALPPRRVRTGTSALSGTVVTAGGLPLSGARVGLADGPQARTNERGEWTISGAPAGSRMLEVRALGYYPDRRAVDVVAGAPPVRVVLATVRSVLDTVKVTANRLYNRDRDGFDRRRRTGHGRYFTAEEIARRNPLNITDLFRSVSGVRLDRRAFDSTSLLVRGTGTGWCSPAVFIDGLYMRGTSADEIDAFAPAHKVAGVEVYVGTHVPAQFQQQMTGCGSIVIWTK